MVSIKTLLTSLILALGATAVNAEAAGKSRYRIHFTRFFDSTCREQVPRDEDTLRSGHCKDWKHDAPPFTGFSYSYYPHHGNPPDKPEDTVCSVIAYPERDCKGNGKAFDATSHLNKCLSIGGSVQSIRVECGDNHYGECSAHERERPLVLWVGPNGWQIDMVLEKGFDGPVS
ncbi:hypothetical protein BAUCODRAFT_552112 [Baudoinia panamericana UAMH 10762]|uniref:Uncharacterized protein n=1 Tax=Baudoinia panamericana (strain UAMH 10762) TaxID=717646 RepID=M2MST5_BAUPA|nr:uncharacterized protein BAUCODRAFT_552112 [Baudoinia panamericana UAMH 10762]EMC94563.1 hypothetical protein BAUCODRAFT_552112 [Baudoinia panamericana UAMH 10762]